MPAPKSAPATEPDPTPAATAPAKPAEPEAVSAIADTPTPDPVTGLLPAGVYAYTAPHETCYYTVPLTARPGTVFHWAAGAPSDGRWEPTRRKPNTLPDNTPAAVPEED